MASLSEAVSISSASECELLCIAQWRRDWVSYHVTACRECLRGSVVNSMEPEIRCPFDNGEYICGAVISEREIKAVSIGTISIAGTDPENERRGVSRLLHW